MLKRSAAKDTNVWRGARCGARILSIFANNASTNLIFFEIFSPSLIFQCFLETLSSTIPWIKGEITKKLQKNDFRKRRLTLIKKKIIVDCILGSVAFLTWVIWQCGYAIREKKIRSCRRIDREFFWKDFLAKLNKIHFYLRPATKVARHLARMAELVDALD